MCRWRGWFQWAVFGLCGGGGRGAGPVSPSRPHPPGKSPRGRALGTQPGAAKCGQAAMVCACRHCYFCYCKYSGLKSCAFWGLEKSKQTLTFDSVAFLIFRTVHQCGTAPRTVAHQGEALPLRFLHPAASREDSGAAPPSPTPPRGLCTSWPAGTVGHLPPPPVTAHLRGPFWLLTVRLTVLMAG